MRPSRRSTLAITVSQPCHEDWARMTPTARGRHCAACEKVVVDFTRQTDAELLAWFAQPANRQTCGRFRPDQLDRPLQPPTVLASRWRRWLAATVALWALRETAPTAPQAQTLPTQLLSPRVVQLGQRPSSTAPGTLSGQVLSAQFQQPLPNIEVQLSGTRLQTTTDHEGRFTLTLPAALDANGQPWQLVCRLSGYEPQLVDLPTNGQPVLLAPLLAVPGLELRGMLGGAGVRGVQLRTQEEPKHNQPLLNLEDWLR